MERSARHSADTLAEVHEGMRVIDAADEEIGTVQWVQQGDPDAVPAPGRTGGVGEAALAEGLAEHLLRVGFVKIDGSWVFGQPVYATPDQIGAVTGDTVRLAATKRELAMGRET
jgi:hypothetical protein